MLDTDDPDKLPLPKNWPRFAKRAVCMALSLLKAAFNIELGRRFDCAARQAREHADHERLRLDGNTDREVLRLLRARFGRLAPRKRTPYTRSERFRILELKAANGWSAVQTAERFLVDDETVGRWAKELADQGKEQLLATEPPVNKFPDFVDRIIAHMAVAIPNPTKRKIATRLARAGLHISASAVYDRLKASPEPDSDAAATEETPAPAKSESPRTVAAHYPNHVWNVDFTAVPIRGGFWSPLLPFAFPQVWPFCWWVAVAVDMFSRKAMGFAVFKKLPTSRQVQEFLERAFDAVGEKPKYFVTDHGKQFDCKPFKNWCQSLGITPRFGAVGKYGSIAIIERFNRTLKYEGLCQNRSAPSGPAGHHHDSRFAMVGWERGVPHAARTVIIDRMREETRFVVEHYNRFRPHEGLLCRTPDEVYSNREPAVEKPRWEPRPKWPRESGCAAPYVPVKGECGTRLKLEIRHLEGRKHLPIFRLREAA